MTEANPWGYLTMYDAANPPTPPPPTDVVLIYAGGDTPHPWSDAEIAAQPAPYRLPCWVRSNPGQASAVQDAGNFGDWLRAHSVPPGCATLLDLETAIDAGYVTVFAGELHRAGWLVLEYGSSSTLEQNPPTDGYLVAGVEPPFETPVVGVQYAYAGPYDLSYLSPTLPLWAASGAVPAPPPPVPAPPPAPGDDYTLEEIELMATADPGLVVRLLYDRFLGRIPDPAGYATDVAFLEAGNSAEQLLVNLQESPEGQAYAAERAAIHQYLSSQASPPT